MQIKIPREAIDEIKSKFNCEEDDAVRAYSLASGRAATAFTETLDEELGKKSAETPVLKLFTPREIKQHLDKFVIGQEEYKKRFCISTAYHFATVRYLREKKDMDEKLVRRFRKKNTIIAGPTGSGKTYCAEVLGDLLSVPTLIIDSTDYTEAGYVGKSADDMIRELIDMAPGADRRAQARFISENGGIIFIDEIDKKSKDGAGMVGHDISREGFQRSLLKLMERKLVPIENPYSAAAQIQEAMEKQQGHKPGKEDSRMLATDNILFVLGGSFERAAESLIKLIRKRVEHHGQLTEEGDIIVRGFEELAGGKSSAQSEKQDLRNYLAEANADDYIRFGLLPELVGRAPIRTYVNALSKKDLVRIMSDTEDSILNQYRLEFSLFGITADFSEDAVEYAAELAEKERTGARALVSVWETILTDFQFELPGSALKSLNVTRELCERPRDALLDLLERSPFSEFIEKFQREHGIELIIDKDVQQHIRDIARESKKELAATLDELLAGTAALNYMDHRGQFRITNEMVDDPKYFDRLFSEWYLQRKRS